MDCLQCGFGEVLVEDEGFFADDCQDAGDCCSVGGEVRRLA